MFIIEYFLRNTRLNHIMLIFLLIMGIGAYQKIPKEMFPDMAINTIVIKGGYAGSSTTTLEKMAVRDIEESLASINGITETATTIIPGSFSIVIELSDSIDPTDTLNKIKDILASTSNNLPSDMRTPTASLSIHSNNLMRIAISSDQKSYEELINIGDEIKNQIAKMDRISEVSVVGGSDKEVRITLDQKIIEAYGLNPSQVSSAISSLSYTFPVGEIKEKGNFVFVSTANGKTSEKEWEAAILKIGEKFITLGSIASVNIFYPQETTLSTYNSKPNLTLNVSKDPEGDAIAMAKILREQTQKIAPKYENVVFDITYDSSKRVKSRLDTVISNLAFGLILVFLTMYYLINLRTALVVTMGVPFAFVIGLLFLYYQGSTMNLVSLLGALIVIGIVVDDAIVVSENIQRHMDEGMEKEKAVIQGTKEMLLPVTLATATTIIAFMPIFSLSAEIGRFFVLIPVVISIVLIGSLVESFLFLPLHAKELYKPHAKSRDWTKANDIYEAILHRVIKYKKTALVFFFVFIPIATFYTAKSLNFQFMPRYDGDFVYISGKLDNNTPLEETHKIARQLEKEIMALKNEYFIKAASLSTGSRRNLLGEGETGENLFYITLELHEMAEENWVNKYINPILTLSFDINNDEKTRTIHSYMIANKVKSLLEPLKKKYSMQELGITSDRPGLLNADIKINLVSQDDIELEKSVAALQKKLESMNGVKDVGNNIKYGKEEYKLKVNPYGEKLGLNETIIAQTISRYYLGNRQGVTFGKDSTMDIITHSTLKDNIQSLKDFKITLSDSRSVALKDVVDFIIMRDYEKLEKVDGEIIKTVYANVDPKVITANEVLKELSGFFDELGEKNITVKLKGEQERNEQFKNEILNSVIFALFGILVLLLFIFPKIKYALMVMSVIPFSILGGLLGHFIMDINLTMPSVIGLLGLAGVVINDGIIMLDFLHGTHDTKSFYYRAKLRLRPIVITTLTTFAGLATLIFYATGQAVIMQPLAVSLGFGLLWGTVLNLFYLPALYAVVNKIHYKRE